MSTADDIRARARGGTQIGGPYNEGNTSPVNVYRDATGAVYWQSGMSIDCDGQPGSACNINTDPYFQAQTAWNQSNGQPIKDAMQTVSERVDGLVEFLPDAWRANGERVAAHIADVASHLEDFENNLQRSLS